MTDWIASHIPPSTRHRDTVQDVPLPKPQPFGAPVLISDCATPLAGETVLALLMKRMMGDEDAEP